MEPPVFICKQIGRQLVFRCPYCKREHRHGLPPGHRIAHCIDRNSPLAETGYILKLAR